MPLPDPPPTRVQAPKWAGIGLRIPPRRADCSCVRPSWYPFQINVCDCDDTPAPDPYTGRQLTVPPAPVPPVPYPPGDPCA
jgi:hypothetical protein